MDPIPQKKTAGKRLDVYLVEQKLSPTRSQAESRIRLGDVSVNGKPATKPGTFIKPKDTVKMKSVEQYVSRAGLKLASVAQALSLSFEGTVVLDVGSSTGGFTDYSLRNGAKKVFAVDVGTDQLHPSLQGNPRIELHEKTDIRDVSSSHPKVKKQTMPAVVIEVPDIIVIDVSFISLHHILPHLADFVCGKKTRVVAMCKPQFEASQKQVNKGVVKNDRVRREILKDFEKNLLANYKILNKADSLVPGAKGNCERFYLLLPL
jgi:23S rRNA (cytidine1920-2'-O)/16S rRNA (cytidine1409-2'-O)-methyltransferase